MRTTSPARAAAPLATRPVGVIAIPVKDEEERIGACLRALTRAIARARGRLDVSAVVLLFNNCTDASAAIAMNLAHDLPCDLVLRAVTLPPERANAGVARRLAADLAAAALAERGMGGFVFVTDADSEVAEDWLCAQWRALRGGADVVAGRVDYDPRDMRLWPAHLRLRERREEQYRRMLTRLGHVIDPDPHDVWPRHDHASGASLGFSLAAYRKIGGVPEIPVGEDRAFVAQAKRVGCRVRHDGAVAVKTSGRMKGRAPGGAAETIHFRALEAHAMCDDRLEPARDAIRRFVWRRDWRALHAQARTHAGALATWSRRLDVAGDDLRAAAHAPTFQASWQRLEELSPALTRAPVPFASLDEEIARARLALDQTGRALLRQTSTRYPAWRSESISRANGLIAAPNADAASSPLNG